MFTLKVADARLLRDMVTAISILVDEATFKIEPDGLKLRAMDPSCVAMIDFEWSKSVFEEYVSGEPTKMCINISELLKLLKRASKDEAVSFLLTIRQEGCRSKPPGNIAETLQCSHLKHRRKRYQPQR